MKSLQALVAEEQDTTWLGSIRMMFNSPKYSVKSLVILEGKSDIGLYRAAMPCESIYFDSPCDGKKKVLEYVDILIKEGMGKVYGICDADFDHIRGVSYENIYLTDFHDIEMMMLSREFIRRFFFEYTLHHIYDSSAAEVLIDKIKDQVFNICYLIGILKWVSYDHRLMLNFKKLGYNCFVSVSGFELSFDIEKYIDHVLIRSVNKVDKQYLLELHEEYRKKDADLVHICNGHDFTYLLGLLYRGEISNDTEINQNRVERSLRLTYDLSHFCNTQLYSNIQNIRSSSAPEFQGILAS